MSYAVRPATLDDVPTLAELIRTSTRRLSRHDYTTEQIDVALQGTMGVDSGLIRDRTYFVVEAADGLIVACGGWSKRKALFGADSRASRESDLLDPSRAAARVRAFFVHPDWARRGLGRLLLAHCEAEACAHGFRAVELMATLPGQRLYLACGYLPDAPVQHPLNETLTIQLVPMRKELRGEHAARLAPRADPGEHTAR